MPGASTGVQRREAADCLRFRPAARDAFADCGCSTARLALGEGAIVSQPALSCQGAEPDCARVRLLLGFSRFEGEVSMAERRLAAVLAADMVGYSRLMEADEAGTLARLKDPPAGANRSRHLETTRAHH